MTKLDWAVAQGLGDQALDSALYRLRRGHEGTLRKVENELKVTCTKAQQLHANFEAQAVPETDISADIDALLIQAETEISGKARSCARSAQILEAFRLRNGLTRAPIAPPVAINVIILMLLVLIESAINASFFANAHMVAGAFAALLTSVLISLTNISVSTVGGFFIGRWMNYGINAEDANAPAFAMPRLKARIAFVLLVCALAFFHVTVGLVRATESLEIVHHTLANYRQIITTPEALFLVMTGICLSIMAFNKGRHAFDDPYPGYGSRYRALEMLRDEVIDAYEDFRDQIEDRFDNAEQATSKIVKSRMQALHIYNAAVKDSHAAARKLEFTVGEAESTMRMQVAQLASHHRAARGRRSTATEPALDSFIYFESFLPEAVLPALVQDTATNAHQKHFKAQKSQALARLSSHFQSLLNKDEENA